ncbi:hypothetical protein [Riemerella columbina]|uniref:hypothetical protein n=1 Tax=Riemerella columbina TaxID=103810 RepID=UPI0026700857|nr:hypothetical protein [Riemerella columbina]WKS95774.1 hypothetical protein NYR17_03275 [Riemerella columbina]
MTITELITITTSISGIVGSIPSILKLPFISNLLNPQKNKKSKIKELDIEKLSHFTSKDFQEEFINPTMEENIFYELTEINTNQKLIRSYCQFKNKLGKSFTWQNIKNAKQYLKSDKNNNITIEVPKIHIMVKNISLICAFILIFASLFLTIYISNIETSKNIKTIAFLIFNAILYLSLASFILWGIAPIITAQRIKQRINNLEKN